MGTGDNNSAPVTVMTHKRPESSTPLQQPIMHQVNDNTPPLRHMSLHSYPTIPQAFPDPFFPAVDAPQTTPSSSLPSIDAPWETSIALCPGPPATENQSAKKKQYTTPPRAYVRQVNRVQEQSTSMSHGMEQERDKNMENLTKLSKGKNKIFEASECQNTLASGHKQSLGKYEEKASPLELTCAPNNWLNQEESYKPTLIPHSNSNVSNSNAPFATPKSIVVRNTATRDSLVLAGEPNTDLSVEDQQELERSRKRQANTEAARRRRERQKACRILQAKADEIRCETSELKHELTRCSEMCSRIRRENKGLLEEIEKMSDADEFAEFIAQDPDRGADTPSESSSDDDDDD